MALLTRPGAPAAQADVNLAKVRLLFRNAGIAQAVVAINAVVLVFVLGGTTPPTWATLWALAAMGLATARFALARRFFKANPAAGDATIWQRRAIAAAFVAALLWGGGAIAMMIADPGATRLFVSLVIAGMVAGAVPLLSSVPLAFRAYAVPVMLAIILTALFDAHGNRDWMLALIASLYLLAMLQSSRFFHDSLDNSLRLAGQLEDALRKAEAASTAKSQFLATMSHEIRTPLNGILGMAQLLLMPEQTREERNEYARTILNSGQTLLTLLNDILDLSKVEAGKFDLEQVAFAPPQLIREITTLFGELAQGKGLKIETAWLGPDLQRYAGDPARLRQMLSNLVSNAIKFTDQGGVRVEAVEIERSDGAAVLEFAVTDSGIGVPPEKQGLLFKPFSQADSSITREYGGTGLGLSIVHSLAQLMGGGAGVASDAGKGARFWFRIRARVLDGDAESRLAERGAAAAWKLHAAQESAGRILVAEDNPINCKVIEALLRKLRFQTTSVANGQAAVDAISAGLRPQAVLMDIQMPVMDGLAATARIRQWENETGQAHLPIVALTASAFDEDRQRCLAAGMDDFLTKPVDLHELAAVLDKWVAAAK